MRAIALWWRQYYHCVANCLHPVTFFEKKIKVLSSFRFNCFSQLFTILIWHRCVSNSWFSVLVHVQQLIFSTTPQIVCLGKCHKNYIINKNMNLKHIYVEWELRKVVKNNTNGKIIRFSDFNSFFMLENIKP